MAWFDRASHACVLLAAASFACGSSSTGAGPTTTGGVDGGDSPDASGTDGAPSNAGDGGATDSASGADGGGCGATSLLDRPADPSAKGPWPVGAKSTTINGLVTEIWYPAAVGSESGKPQVSYDIRKDLPPDQAAKISDADNPLQPCDCFRDLPLDTTHGPYPLVVFVHGTASFKTQNLDNAVHWASRGFVVMAANHPGLSIASFLGAGGTQDLPGNVKAEIAAIAMASGDLASFSGHVDATRIGLVGHSAGGNGVATMDVPGAAVVIPLSANASPVGGSVVSTLFVGGTADGVVSYASVQGGYANDATRSHKRLVGVAGAGHTGVTSLCGIKNAAGNSIVDVAKASGVLSGVLGGFADTLFDCAKNTTPQADVIPIVNFATSAVLEETLQCEGHIGAKLDGIQGAYPKVQEYQHAP